MRPRININPNTQPGSRRGGVKKLLIFIILIGLIALAYKVFFSGPAMPGGGMMGMGGPMPVSVAEVVEQEAEQWQEFSGKLVAVDNAELRPQVSGVIEKVHFDGGEHVKKGQLLFTIDQRPFRAALDAAEARYTLASSELTRSNTLLKEKALAQREYDQRKNAAEVAKAELTRAKLDYDYTLVKAPVSGRVSRPEITEGNLVSAGSSAPLLTTVVSDRPIYADFEIDERSYLQYLASANAAGKKLNSAPVTVSLSGEGSVEHKGRVQSFDNQLNPSTGTLRVRAVFDNKDGTLIPGLFARIRLASTGDNKLLLIADRAVGTDQNKKFVMVVGDDNKAMYREVHLEGMANGLRIVKDGLKAGETIIIDGLQRVQMPGTPVVPEMVPMDVPPASENPQMPPADAEQKMPDEKAEKPEADKAKP